MPGAIRHLFALVLLVGSMCVASCIERNVVAERFTCELGGLCPDDAGALDADRSDANAQPDGTVDASVGNPCAEAGRQNGDPCDDHDPCTEADTCLDGVCTGRAISCSPTDVCDEPRCDARTGECKHMPRAEGSSCDDGDDCTMGDVCSRGGCVPTGAAADGLVCTSSSLPGAGLCVSGLCSALTTCKDLSVASSPAPSGIYALSPAHLGVPFPVRCEMEAALGGGWTLVGRELAGSPAQDGQSDCAEPQSQNGTFRYLSGDTLNADALAVGGVNGLIGARLVGRYEEVMIRWGQEWLAFRLRDFDMFSDEIVYDQPISEFRSTDPALETWVENGGGAILCVAASPYFLARPGDTSWAIKPASDAEHHECGCNSMGWVGRGAFYGGTRTPEHNACCGWGGGFAGSRGDGEQKGAITPDYDTEIWVR